MPKYSVKNEKLEKLIRRSRFFNPNRNLKEFEEKNDSTAILACSFIAGVMLSSAFVVYRENLLSEEDFFRIRDTAHLACDNLYRFDEEKEEWVKVDF